ncbi:unnamed protein product [Mytilus coruscus]|uniref:Uncharacterized protein n=1 Tax=Mytilus coruscus TaxID=42192 RepID=A0A6J8DS78_MYTCO|nr:unnamed protein product [Mytilus coruscus]
MAHFIKFLFLFGLLCVDAQYIPLGVSKKQPTCKYEFTVPDTKGACSATSTALEQKIDNVKQDLDRTRIQYVSQNSIVQGTLAQLQSDTKMYVSKVNDLNGELQKIKQGVSPGQPSGTVNQLIHDTKDLLTKAVGDINGRIFNLSLEFQRNAIEESKVNSAIQNQINKQAVQLATAEQKLLNLENMIKNYKPPTSGSQPQPSTGPSIAQLITLEKKYQKLENDLKSVDSLQQQQFTGLSDKTNKIMSQLLNQSHDIDVVAQATNQSVARLTAAEKLIQTTKQDFDNFKRATDPQIKILSQEASGLLNNLTSIEKQLQQLGIRLLNGQVASMQMKGDVVKVKKQADSLLQEITKLSSQITAQAGELLAVKSDLSGLKGPSTGGSGGTVNIQKLVNTIKNQTQADIQKAQNDVKQVQNMVTTLLTQVALLSSKVNKLCPTTPSG